MASVGKKIYLKEVNKNTDDYSSGFLGLLFMTIWFAKKYPIRGMLSAFLLILSTAAEGLGLAAIIPLLGTFLSSNDSNPTSFEKYTNYLLESINLNPTFETLLLILLVAVVLKSILRYMGLRTVGFFTADISKGIRRDILDKIANVEWSYFVANKTGEIAAALTHASEKTSSTGTLIAKFIAVFFQVIVVLILSSLISTSVTFLSIGVGLITFILLGGFVRMARAAGLEQTNVMNSFTSRLIDSINAIKPIKAMGSGKRITTILHNDVDDLNQSQKKLVYSSVMLDVIPEPIAVLAIAIALFTILNSAPPQPELLIGLMLLFARGLMSLHMMQAIYKNLAAGQAAFWFIRSMNARLEKYKEVDNGSKKHSLNKEITINNASFAYDKKYVIESVNAKIPVGKIVTFTGGSGAGKTTIVDLIIGLLTPSNGSIDIDGINLNDLDKQFWREQIGYVPQDTFMFHDSVYSNITLGDDYLDRASAKQALIDSEAIGFVDELENGIDTIVGERGMMLSGGQRQRLSIARALVRKPKLLILDEATSSLDPESEKSICETLIKLRKENDKLTILAITHQRALVDIADIVYSVKSGKITKI